MRFVCDLLPGERFFVFLKHTFKPQVQRQHRFSPSGPIWDCDVVLWEVDEEDGKWKDCIFTGVQK